jgi:4-amino-4-deoxy-L-arabinose transferase-like glycosyltransferase
MFDNRSPYAGLTHQAPSLDARKWFFIFIAAHILIWTLVPTVMRHVLPADTAEGIAWGRLWLWGYEKHPFLAPWLTNISAILAGGKLGWPQYLLAQGVVGVAFWATWRLAVRLLPSVQALIAVVLLEGVYYYNVASPQFNPNILMLATWALALLTFYIAASERKPSQWIMAGFCAGLAMMAKYESILLLLAMLLFTLVIPEVRQEYRKKGLYLGALVLLLVCLPNLIWLQLNHWQPVVYTEMRLDTDHFHGLATFLNYTWHPFYFFLEQVGAIVPVIILFLPFFFCTRNTRTSIGRFNALFLWIVGLGGLWAALIYSAVTGAWLHSLWAFPFFSVVGILLVAWWRPIISRQSLKQFLILLVTLVVLTAGIRGAWLRFEPYIKHKMITSIFPGDKLAKDVTRIWRAHYHTPLQYVAGHHSFVEYISAYSSDKPTPYFDWSMADSPWINEAKLKQVGAVFVWRGSSSNGMSVLPADIKKRFPRTKVLPVLIEKDYTDAAISPYIIDLALLPPEKKIAEASALR